jgi:hypothetical protein
MLTLAIAATVWLIVVFILARFCAMGRCDED